MHQLVIFVYCICLDFTSFRVLESECCSAADIGILSQPLCTTGTSDKTLSLTVVDHSIARNCLTYQLPH